MAGNTKLTPLDKLDAETNSGDDPVTVELIDVEVRVKPVKRWKSSGIRAMREGDFDTWAEKCLADPDSYAVWRELDPDIEEIEAFFEAWGEVSGQTVGESRASRRSAKSTARR